MTEFKSSENQTMESYAPFFYYTCDSARVNRIALSASKDMDILHHDNIKNTQNTNFYIELYSIGDITNFQIFKFSQLAPLSPELTVGRNKPLEFEFISNIN